MQHAESKIDRLRQLVNHRYNFYPKSVTKLDDENINKYDSEEEEELYKQEENEDKNVNLSPEIKKETNRKFVKKEFKLNKKLVKHYVKETKEFNLKKQENNEKTIVGHNVYKDQIEDLDPFILDKMNIMFKSFEYDCRIEDQLQKLKSLYQIIIREPKNIEKQIDTLTHLHYFLNEVKQINANVIGYTKILEEILEINEKHNESRELFKTEILVFILDDLIQIFKTIKILPNFSFTEKDETQFIDLCMFLFKFTQKAFELGRDTRTISNIINSCFIFIEYFISIQNISTFLLLLNNYLSKQAQFKSIFLSFSQKLLEIVHGKNCLNLNSNHTKIIFLFCFSILSFKQLANIHILSIKIICKILLYNKDYLDKFFDNIIQLFKQFVDSKEEMQILFPFDEKIYRDYCNYFGIYKSYDNSEISLFSYLLINMFSILYEDLENIKKNNYDDILNFNKIFESFFLKISDSKNISLNFLFFTFSTDLIKVKYCIEFSIIPVLLTNLFMLFSSILESFITDLSKRKFFFFLYEKIIDNCLHDFHEMTNLYLCFKEDENCNDCFSCEYQVSKEERVFTECTDCSIKTNIFFEEKEKIEESECEFCRINKLYNDFSFDSEVNKNLVRKLAKCKEKDKIFRYQEILSKYSINFLKFSSIFYLFTSINNDVYSNDIDLSFNIFLQQYYVYDKNKSNENELIKDLHEFYYINKNKIANLTTDFNICTLFYNYFIFYLHYINFLFISQIKLIDILFEYNNHWNIRYRSLKLLEKFLIFEKEKTVFKHFNVDILVSLLEDNSLHIKEYTLEMLLQMNHNKKLSDSDLFFILYKNINDPSILIRRKITKIIITNYEQKTAKIERVHLKNICTIFLNKFIDSAESKGIKAQIGDFFRRNLKSLKSNSLAQTTIEIIISILQDKEDLKNNINLYYDNISYLISQIAIKQEKANLSLSDEDFRDIIEHIIENYLDISNGIQILNSLLLMKLISTIKHKSLFAFIEFFIENLNLNDLTKDSRIENRVKSYLCEIIGNTLEKYDLKTNLMINLEDLLLKLTLTKPNFVMFSALDCYFKILKKKKLSFNKINELVSKTVYFMENQNIERINSKNDELISVLQRSLCLLSYIFYLSDNIILCQIFTFIPLRNSENIIKYIFDLYQKFALNCSDIRIRFKAFECFGYIWIRNPHLLSISNNIIEKTLDLVKVEEEKIIVLKTLNNFFSNLSKIFIQMKIKTDDEKTSFDFGIVHLFFENFYEKIIDFSLDYCSEVVRIHGITLLNIIIELGNIHVYKALPYIFSSIFDYSEDVRFRAVKLLENIVKISREKFISSLKDCLKMSFSYQSKIFFFPIYFNSFVKAQDKETDNKKTNKTSLFKILNSENVFDMFLSKIDKKLNFHSLFIEKIFSIWSEINSIDINDDFEKTLNMIEYYTFLANLVCDYRYPNFNHVVNSFNKLKEKVEMDYIVFKTQLKSYKLQPSLKIEKKFISQAIINLLQITMMKYFLIKFDNFNSSHQKRVINKKGLKNSIEDEEDNYKEEVEDKIMFNKDIKGLRFYEFLTCNHLLVNHILILFKKKKNKENLISSISKIKQFYKIPISTLRGHISTLKKKLNVSKISKEEFTTILHDKIFIVNLKEIIQETPMKPINEFSKNTNIQTENKHDRKKIHFRRKSKLQTENQINKRKKALILEEN